MGLSEVGKSGIGETGSMVGAVTRFRDVMGLRERRGGLSGKRGVRGEGKVSRIIFFSMIRVYRDSRYCVPTNRGYMQDGDPVRVYTMPQLVMKTELEYTALGGWGDCGDSTKAVLRDWRFLSDLVFGLFR